MQHSASSVALSFAAAVALALSAPASSQTWRPTQNVEIITGAGAGSSQDRAARAVQQIFQARQLIPVSSAVLNKAGGGNAVALAYLQQRPADGHYLLTSSTTLLTNHITGRSQTRHSDVTAIAMLYDDYNVFSVKPDSPIASGKDLLERLRKDPASVSVGFATSVGNSQHVSAAMAAQAAGLDPRKMKAVVFNASSEAKTAALGGHIDVIVTPAATVVPELEAGKLRVIAVTSSQRLDGVYANTPTWKELGVSKAFFGTWGAVLVHRGTPAAQIAYWENTFQSLVATPDWKNYLRTHYLSDLFMRGAEAKDYLERQYGEYKAVLTDMGLVR